MIEDAILRRALALQAHASQVVGHEARIARTHLDLLCGKHPGLEDYLAGGGSTEVTVVPRSPWHCDLALRLGENLSVCAGRQGLVFSGPRLAMARFQASWCVEERRLSGIFEVVGRELVAGVGPISVPAEKEQLPSGSRAAELIAKVFAEAAPPQECPPWWGQFLESRPGRSGWFPARGRHLNELASLANSLVQASVSVTRRRLGVYSRPTRYSG
jgi:hypothetical protein